MAPSDYRPSRRHTLWTSIRSFSCFSTAKPHRYISLSADSLPLLSEKPSFQPTIPASKPSSPDPTPTTSSKKPLSPSPPRGLTRWPSSHNLKTCKRSIMNVPEVHDADPPPPPAEEEEQDERTPRSSRAAGTTVPAGETELKDQLSLMDTANMLGAVAGVVGAGYAGAAYHQQRKVGEEQGEGEDVEMGLRRSQATQQGAVRGGTTTDVEQQQQQQQQRGTVGEVTRTESSAEQAYASSWTGMK